MNNPFFSLPNPAPVCAGTGLLALDIIFNGSSGVAHRLWAGGSCGKVLTVLSYLGWQSFPVARLGKDMAASKILADIDQFHVCSDFIERDKNLSTPIIVERIRKGSDGSPIHRFFWICPNCGAWFPRYRPLLLSAAKHAAINLPQMQCFYFDRVSPGALELAERARKSGALVVFEPPSVKDESAFWKAIKLSHILKYAHGRERHFEFLTSENCPPFVIETLGKDGMRYKLRKKTQGSTRWKTLPAYRVNQFRDAAGSGDWCTAGIIHMLGRKGSHEFKTVSENRLIEALQFGQAMAALNCQFEGARGGMYSLEKTVFMEEINDIIGNQVVRKGVSEVISDGLNELFTCLSPGCKGRSTIKEKKRSRKPPVAIVYKVLPNEGGGWCVRKHDALRDSSKHKTKNDAIVEAKKKIKAQRYGTVLIYKKNGTIQAKCNIGHWPSE